MASQVNGTNIPDYAPVPAFIKASHIPFDDLEQTSKISLKISNPVSRNITPTRNPHIESRNKHYLRTPLLHQTQNEKLGHYFYPSHQDKQGSFINNHSNGSITNMLVTSNFDPNGNNTSSKRKHAKMNSKFSNDTGDKFTMYDMPANSVTMKKQYKYNVKIGSTNDASTMRD